MLIPSTDGQTDRQTKLSTTVTLAASMRARVNKALMHSHFSSIYL